MAAGDITIFNALVFSSLTHPVTTLVPVAPCALSAHQVPVTSHVGTMLLTTNFSPEFQENEESLVTFKKILDRIGPETNSVPPFPTSRAYGLPMCFAFSFQRCL